LCPSVRNILYSNNWESVAGENYLIFNVTLKSLGIFSTKINTARLVVKAHCPITNRQQRISLTECKSYPNLPPSCLRSTEWLAVWSRARSSEHLCR